MLNKREISRRIGKSEAYVSATIYEVKKGRRFEPYVIEKNGSYVFDEKEFLKLQSELNSVISKIIDNYLILTERKLGRAFCRETYKKLGYKSLQGMQNSLHKLVYDLQSKVSFSNLQKKKQILSEIENFISKNL